MRFVAYFNALVALLLGLAWAGSIVYLRLRRGKGLRYLLLFSLFYLYIVIVLYYTLFQFQSLIVLKYFMPGLMLRGAPAGKAVNLIPLATLTLKDLKTSLLNILLFLPLGFGLPFITRARWGRVVAIGAAFSITIELLQFITGFAAGITFRIADINDVLFNTLGAAAGYLVFLGFVHSRRLRRYT